MTDLGGLLERRSLVTLGTGAAAAVALAIWGVFDLHAAIVGWLIGFAAAGSVPLGAVALLSIHGLTGGRWGDAIRPVLLAAALALPLVLVAFLPLAAFSHAVYPWAADPAAAGANIGHVYLTPVLFTLRSVVVLALLSIFAVRLPRGPLPTLAAGLCLCVYAGGMDLLAYDWLLSLDPHFNASAFGVQLILTQLIAAIGFVLLVSSAPPEDPSWPDLGALLLACLLGLIYLVFMTFLIDWYGDLPDQAAWFLRRSRHGWRALEIVGGTACLVVPTLALLVARVRHAVGPLRAVAALALLGVAGQMVWLAAPGAGARAVGAGLLGIVAAAGLLAGLAPQVAARLPRSRSTAHGH